MDIIKRLLAHAKELEPYRPFPGPSAEVLRDAAEAIEQLRAQVQMLGKEPVA